LIDKKYDVVWGVDRYSNEVSDTRGELIVPRIAIYQISSLRGVKGWLPHDTKVRVLERLPVGEMGRNVYRVSGMAGNKKISGWLLGTFLKKKGLKEPGIEKLTNKENRRKKNGRKNN
jgi:hypothetical protein